MMWPIFHSFSVVIKTEINCAVTSHYVFIYVWSTPWAYRIGSKRGHTYGIDRYEGLVAGMNESQ